MSDKNRRLLSGLFGLLFGLALVIRGRLIDFVELRSQGVPLDVNWPFCILAIVISVGVTLAVGWPRRRLLGVIFGIIVSFLAFYGVILLKINIDPRPFFALAAFGFIGLAFVLSPFQKFLPQMDAFFVHMALLLTFTVVVLLVTGCLLALERLSVKQTTKSRWMVALILVGVTALGFFCGTGYQLGENKREVLRANEVIQAALIVQNTAVSQESVLRDFTQRMSLGYTLDAGPYSNGTAINIYFDNGLVLGCVMGITNCREGQLIYNLGAF